MLATGGAAALWARTTNPPGAIGGGLLLAYDAGAELADLELMQFHPTGGASGRRTAPTASWSPRRSAARARGCSTPPASASSTSSRRATRSPAPSSARSKSSGASSVGLDMRDVDPALFPNVVSALRRAGIDPERELVPVAPAAHYMMGGIATDLDGRATLPGLYAVGECSCTGLHGANRLASNSLSECFVFGARAARAALAEPAGRSPTAPIGPTAGEPPRSRDHGRVARRAVALRRAASAAATACGPGCAIPHPLVRLIAQLGAGPRGEPRRPPAHRLPGSRSGPRRPPRDAAAAGRPTPRRPRGLALTVSRRHLKRSRLSA